MSEPVKYGLLAGLITVAYLLTFYFIGPVLMLNPWVTWASLLIYIVFMMQAGRCERERTEGAFPFRQALRPVFTVFVVATVVYYVFYYLMFKIFDPGLTEMQRQLALEAAQRAGGVLGEENAGELLRGFRNTSFEVTIGNTLLSLAWSLIGGFALSAIIAAALKRG